MTNAAFREELSEMIESMTKVKGEGYTKIVVSIFSLSNFGAAINATETLVILPQLVSGIAEHIHKDDLKQQRLLHLSMVEDIAALVNKQSEYSQGKKNGPSTT